jgi:formylglycine-generating enzyme required for sulfatase activity
MICLLLIADINSSGYLGLGLPYLPDFGFAMIRYLLLMCSTLLLTGFAFAMLQGKKGERYAFLVSCGKYNAAQLKALPYATAEMDEFRKVLVDSGYEPTDIVFLKDGQTDASLVSTRENILKQFDLMVDGIFNEEDSILVAFNGHGVQFKGDPTGYFCPINANLKDRKSLIPTEEIFKRLSQCKAKQKILLVNACRNDPGQFPNQAANQIDLDVGDKDIIPEGIAALYSCKDQQLSYYYPETSEYKERKRSLFFHNLIETWKSGTEQDDYTVEELFSQVRKKTTTEARLIFGESQTPEIRRKVEGMGEWKLTARKELVKRPEMKKPEPKAESKNAKELTFDLGNGVKLEMVRIPKGKFLMGSPKEGPQHEVTLTKDFYLGKYEVTQAQWEELMGSNPSYFKLKNGPVEQVSWEECQEYIKKLNAKLGSKAGRFRLPTEAEWEYACRAGSKTQYSFGDLEADLGDYGWYDKNSNDKPHEVGSRKPNKFGLYDMHGNVWEWCGDWYDDKYDTELVTNPSGPGKGSSRVLRGGSWDVVPLYCRSAVRFGNDPTYRNNNLGFRLALVPSE